MKRILIISLCWAGLQSGLISTALSTEITTKDLNQEALTAGKVPDPTRVKFEMVSYNPYEAPRPRGSIVGKAFKTFSLLSTPAFFFPGVGTAIGAAGMSLGGLGTHMDNRASQPAAAERPMQIYTPGLNQGGSGGRPTGYTAAGDSALDIISAKR